MARRHVDELRIAGPGSRKLHPFVVQRERVDLRATRLEGQRGPGVPWVFHADPVAGVEHQPRDEVERLLHPRHDRDLLGTAAYPS
jgi:hypothetical protein